MMRTNGALGDWLRVWVKSVLSSFQSGLRWMVATEKAETAMTRSETAAGLRNFRERDNEARCGENEEETEADGGEIEVAFGEDVPAYGVDVHCGKEGDSDPERGEGRERDPAHEVDEAGDGGENEDDGCDGARVGEGADGREDVVGVELERPCQLQPIGQHEVRGGEEELERVEGPVAGACCHSAEHAQADDEVESEYGPVGCACFESGAEAVFLR